MLVCALWNLVGVILHESMHLIAGILFRAHPTGISLIPRRKGNQWRLGAVHFTHINPINAVPIALAPLVLIGIAYLAVLNWFHWFPSSLPATLGLYAALFILLYNALPSHQDLRIACNWKSLLLYLPVLALLGIYLFRSH